MDRAARNHAFITLFERKMANLRDDNPDAANDVYNLLITNTIRIQDLCLSKDKRMQAAAKRMLSLLEFERKLREPEAEPEPPKMQCVHEGTGESTKGNPDGEIVRADICSYDKV